MHPLGINLRHLVSRELHLEGTISAQDLELVGLDKLVRVSEPVQYDLQVKKVGRDLLVRGRLLARLECQCVRCLKPFPVTLDLPGLVTDLPLEGEDAVPREGDFVDLTPYLREDIVLAFPQHPLCEPGCVGLTKPAAPDAEAQPGQGSRTTSSAWAALNELKLK
jgi:uncharacterized protein